MEKKTANLAIKTLSKEEVVSLVKPKSKLKNY
jgi:hypothetical protein